MPNCRFLKAEIIYNSRLNPPKHLAQNKGWNGFPLTVAYLGIFKCMHTKHDGSNQNNNHN